MAAIGDHIEFIDMAGEEAEVSAEVVTSGPPSIVRLWPALAVAVVVAWLLGSSGDVESSRPLDDSPSPTVAPISPMTDTDQAMGGVDSVRSTVVPPVAAPWPPAADNGDPPVTRLAGDLTERLGSLDRTIVYINVAGGPTVVSFRTGDVFEIDVAAIRVHERFAVEEGEVRALGRGESALREATNRAVVFHTYRDVDSPGVGTVGDAQGRGLGPQLCLSDRSCSFPDQGPTRRVVGGVEVERFAPDAHRDVAQILDTWQPVDDWLVAPDGYRIPAPARFVWVITPRGAASSSSSGVI